MSGERKFQGNFVSLINVAALIAPGHPIYRIR